MSTILRANENELTMAPEAYFHGSVMFQAISTPPQETGVKVVLVHFAEEARTNWHTHPKGQILYITVGVCLYQEWEGETVTLQVGDSITIPAGVKHWHGANSSTKMSHIAVQPIMNGVDAVWLEPVADAQYRLKS